MRIHHIAAIVAVSTIALTACSSSSTDAKPKATKPAGSGLTQEQKDDALVAAGIPKEPTGADRQALLDNLAAAAPDVVQYEDKAIDAARNQCSAINGGAAKLNYLASQRFTYKDVTTTEDQGAKINAALKKSSFCDLR